MVGVRGRQKPAKVSEPVDAVDVLVTSGRRRELRALGQLLGAPFRSELASSSREALLRTAERDFAAIVIDATSPALDGFALARAIRARQRTRRVPLIFVIERDADAPRIYRGKGFAPVDHVVRPVDRDVIRAKALASADLARRERRSAGHTEELERAARRARKLELTAAAAAADKRFANLTQAIPELVVTLDSAGSLEFCNRRWLEYTGLSIEHSRGRGWVLAIHPDDRRRSVRAWERSISSGEVLEIECRLRRGFDGAMRWHTCRALPERDDDGTIVGWLGTYSDSEELKRAIRARDEFLSIASHELRTPLTALKLRLESLAHTAAPDERAARRLNGAIRQTERLERLIDHLLDASRISAGRLVLERTAVSLGEIAGEVVGRAREQPGVTGQVFDLVIEGDVVGTWDRMRIEQVVENLISNALKYGGGRPVGVWVRGADDAVELTVSDHGIGIDAADLSRIFEQYERAEASQGQSGIGMGLYIARQIVQAHAGEIDVESRLGEGSSFRVVLPRSARPPTPLH